MKGKVKWYNFKKGYGFILGDDEKEYFVHFSGILNEEILKQDDIVTFEPTKTEKGVQAQKVQKV